MMPGLTSLVRQLARSVGRARSDGRDGRPRSDRPVRTGERARSAVETIDGMLFVGLRPANHRRS
jgi:hypothetical protein